MKIRFTRPAVVAVALVTGSALVGSPAYAIPGSPDGAPTGQGGATVTEQSASTLDAIDPGTIDPGTTDPGTTDPGTTDPGTTEPVPADPDTTVPTGSFRINYTSVWTGQRVVIGQKTTEFKDEGDDQATLKRVVTWGDGTSTVLSPTAETATKQYNRAGNFKVTVTITDPAGNVSAIPAKTVAVTIPAGQITLNKKAVYQGALFNVKINKVPAGAKTYRIDWADGSFSEHKASQRSMSGYIHYYWKWDAAQGTWVRNGKGRISGVRALKVSWGNDKGYAYFQTAAKINIVKDVTRPGLTIKKPSSTNRASSWKTIKGTVSDKQSGLRHVGVTAYRVTSTGKAYCLTPARKWKRYYTEADVQKYCTYTGVKVKVVNGKWSLTLPAGLGKNQFFQVSAWAYDWADNYRGTSRTAKITRS
ncbi:hypothetical protein Q0Z83_094740 [Actinoplanes sichuanensis]|uniref:PKD domain-containing protein n=1 Tax=Actinoplanes sichuanensis TaxID=512349 RepID=A0ABW4ANU0_9ACTN|nr:PKD domain-containing protein [Actinoplanes sichuanensis]BEL11283.1 hypothetical protein Q0Z83_094740 [Actinoplanes sichuanensis]